MKSIKSLMMFFLWMVFLPAWSADSTLLEKLHGDFLESCQLASMCSDENRTRCISMYRRAFDACDPLFYRNLSTSTSFTDCVSMQIYKELQDITQNIDYEKCGKMSFPDEPYKTEASRPVDNPMALEYFTVNSFDFKKVQLYTDKMVACRTGAKRARESMEKDMPVVVEISITDIRKRYLIGGEGDPGYSHVFSTPAYEIGECIGTVKTKFNKAYSPFRKGEVITKEYEDRLFVAVQCHKEPRHASCGK